MSYAVKLRRYKKGAYGTTIYRFPVQVRAFCFAEGYAAALKDLGMTNLYVSVHDEKGRKIHDV